MELEDFKIGIGFSELFSSVVEALDIVEFDLGTSNKDKVFVAIGKAFEKE